MPACEFSNEGMSDMPFFSKRTLLTRQQRVAITRLKHHHVCSSQVLRCRHFCLLADCCRQIHLPKRLCPGISNGIWHSLIQKFACWHIDPRNAGKFAFLYGKGHLDSVDINVFLLECRSWNAAGSRRIRGPPTSIAYEYWKFISNLSYLLKQ